MYFATCQPQGRVASAATGPAGNAMSLRPPEGCTEGLCPVQHEAFGRQSCHTRSTLAATASCMARRSRQAHTFYMFCLHRVRACQELPLSCSPECCAPRQWPGCSPVPGRPPHCRHLQGSNEGIRPAKACEWLRLSGTQWLHSRTHQHNNQ